MASSCRAVFYVLTLICTLTLAQGHSSHSRSKDADAARDLHAEIAKQAKEQTDKVLSDFKKWVENYKKNAYKYNDLHPQIQQIVHEQVKETIEKHVKDSLNEAFNSAKLISASQPDSQPNRNSRESHHHNQRQNNNRNKDKQCPESEEANPNSQNKVESNSKTIDAKDLARLLLEFADARNKMLNFSSQKIIDDNFKNIDVDDLVRLHSEFTDALKKIVNSSVQYKIDDNSNNIDAEDLARFNSEFVNALQKIENLKLKLENLFNSSQYLTKAELISKLDEVRKELDESVQSSPKNTDSSFKEDDDETQDIDANVDDVSVIIESEINGIRENHATSNVDIHHEIRKHILEILESEIKTLRYAKMDALNAKEELIQAANKLHASHGQPGATFDFQSLAQFKSKVYEVSFRKKQYINQRWLFKTKVREAIANFKSNPGGTTQSGQQQSTEESKETFTYVPNVTAELPKLTTENVQQSADDTEPATESVGHTTGNVGHRVEGIEPAIESVGRTTEHVGHTAESVQHATGSVGHTTEYVGHTTDRAEHTTQHSGQTTEHAKLSTKHIGVTTTEHSERTTGHFVNTTTTAEHTTQQSGHTTKHGGFITTQSVTSHQININTHSASEETQIPDEYTDIQNGEDTNSSLFEIVERRPNNFSSIDADASTQNGGEWNSSLYESVVGRAHNSSSNSGSLKLAANYIQSGDGDDEDENGTVVVVIVLSSLVVCSVVSILGVLMWKRHRRHRLYTKIPSGDVSRQFK